MTTQYAMTAIYNSTTRIYWVVTGAPDNTGAQSGYPTNLLTSIATDYTTSSTVTSSGPTYLSNVWQTALEIDFTAQTTQTFTSDGTYTIAGYTWTKINSANETAHTVLTNGTGIVWTPSSTGDLYTTTRTLPALTINLSTYIPNFTLDTPIRVWLYESTSNEAQDYDSCVLAIERPSSNTNYVLKRGHAGSLVQNATANFNGANQGQTNSTGVYTGNGVMLIECSDGVASLKARHLVGVYNNGFPGYPVLQSVGNLNGETGMNDVQWVGKAADWDVLIGAHRAGSGNNSYTATINRIRIEYININANTTTNNNPQIVSAAYTVQTTDADIFCNLISSAFTVTLPASPFTGEKHTIKDYNGKANTNNLTISGNGKSIEQLSGVGTSSTLVLNSNFSSVTLEYNGTSWSIM